MYGSYGSGHLHRIAFDGETVTDIERDRLHRETGRTQGRLASRYTLDPLGRLKSQLAVPAGPSESKGKAAVTAAVKRSYGYDRTGNLTQSTDPRTGTTQFEYDKLGRITRAGDELFAFDPAHNIVDIPARPSENMPEGIDEKVYVYSCLNGKLSPDILSIEEFDSLISSWLIKNKNGIKK